MRETDSVIGIMTMRFSVFFFALLALFTLSSHGVLALDINGVRVGVTEQKTRLVLDMSEHVDFKVFTLNGPKRLVVDLPHFNWRVGDIESEGQSVIQAVRQGRFNNNASRVVIDLDEAIKIKQAFTLKPNNGQSPRLVIDFAPISVASSPAQSYGSFDAQTSVRHADKHHTQVRSKTPTPDTKPRQAVIKSKPLIVIDPGHGGVDPGAIAKNKTYEKHVVLKLAKELKKQLEDSGRYRVLLTRNDDRYIKLYDRVKFARRNNADLFISIHADSIEDPHVQGASIYTLSETASDKQTAKLAAKENRADLIAGIDLSVEDEDVASILVDLAMRDTMNQSNFLANTTAGAFKSSKVKTLKKTHRSAGFAVLKAPDIPSMLVEAGFLSSATEAKRLNTTSYRRTIATTIKRSIDLYFSRITENERL